MKADDLDIIYITTPMSKEERISLLKKFRQAAFIQGIDKGSFLESCKIERFNNYKERKMHNSLIELIDYMNERMQPGIKRYKRKKYRGLYKYPKKSKKAQTVFSPPVVSYSNRPVWMQKT